MYALPEHSRIRGLRVWFRAFTEQGNTVTQREVQLFSDKMRTPISLLSIW